MYITKCQFKFVSVKIILKSKQIEKHRNWNDEEKKSDYDIELCFYIGTKSYTWVFWLKKYRLLINAL